MKLSALVASGLLSASAIAHSPSVSRRQIERRNDLAKRCAPQVGQFTKKRQAKRAANMKRELASRSGNATFEITTEAPFYDNIQNSTCVLTPDITSGPYIWPYSQTLRQDMTEDQPGVPLLLDVGVLDMATCEPLPNALVSFWHCNATGSYSSFTNLSPNTKFETLLQEMNITDFAIGSTDLHTDNTTFLRGMWPTDAEGLMEMKTVFPGFYVERAIHIHTQVFTDWVLRENGTVANGNLVSTGQLFFDEALEEQIMALEPYVSHTEINRTANDVDSQGIYTAAQAGGFNPVVDIAPLDGVNVENGMVGYITMGIDTTNIADEAFEANYK